MSKSKNRLHSFGAAFASAWLFGSIGLFALMHVGNLTGPMAELLPFGAGRILVALRDFLAPLLGAGFRE